MTCHLCGKKFVANDLIVRGIICKILNIFYEEIECDGNDPALDMHFACFKNINNVPCTVVKVKPKCEVKIEGAAVQRTNALDFVGVD